MQNAKLRKRLFAMLAVAALTALFVLAGCGDDDDGEETMMPEPMGYKVTVTNNLSEELFAPIVVTHASNDNLLFDGDNYVTMAAQTQILTGSPDDVSAAIEADGGYAVIDKGTEPDPHGNMVLLGPDQSIEIMFDGDATALRILAMVAPTMYDDHYVSAVADVPMNGSVTVPLSRFDIGYDEMTMDNMRLMDIRLVAENAGTVTIERLGDAMADDGDMMDAVTYTVEVTNDLSESGELFAPIVVTRANDEHYLFDGTYVTDEAKDQILTGSPAMVIDVIGEDNAVFGTGSLMPPLLTPGEPASIMFDTDATALRIIAMVAPTPDYPDNYVSAVVNVADLMSDESVTAPLTRFDIGDDEMTMDITRIDDDMTVGTVMITRQ